MRVCMTAGGSKPQGQAPKIRRAIAAARAPFVQQRDGLQQAGYRREGARAQQLRLGAVPAVRYEPTREAGPALVPRDEPCADRFGVHLEIARGGIACIALGGDLQQRPLERP